MQDFATSTAPSKATATATSAANAHCSSSAPAAAGDVPRRGGDRLGGLEHLGAQVLDRLEAADLLAELLAHLGVLDRGRQAPARDAGGLGGGQRDRRTPEQVGRQAGHGHPGRRVEHPRRAEPAAQVEAHRRGRLDRVAWVEPTRPRPRRRAARAWPTARPRRRRARPIPTTASSGSLGQDERGDRRPEQRPGHQLVGARLERDGHVEHRYRRRHRPPRAARWSRCPSPARPARPSAKVASASVSAARASSRPLRSAAHLRRLAASSTCSSEIPIDMRILIAR